MHLANPGPCKGSFRKYAYDVFGGYCSAFNYSGCGGNPNRFNNLAYCELKCSLSSTEPEYGPYNSGDDPKATFIPPGTNGDPQYYDQYEYESEDETYEEEEIITENYYDLEPKSTEDDSLSDSEEIHNHLRN